MSGKHQLVGRGDEMIFLRVPQLACFPLEEEGELSYPAYILMCWSAELSKAQHLCHPYLSSLSLHSDGRLLMPQYDLSRAFLQRLLTQESPK